MAAGATTPQLCSGIGNLVEVPYIDTNPGKSADKHDAFTPRGKFSFTPDYIAGPGSCKNAPATPLRRYRRLSYDRFCLADFIYPRYARNVAGPQPLILPQIAEDICPLRLQRVKVSQ